MIAAWIPDTYQPTNNSEDLFMKKTLIALFALAFAFAFGAANAAKHEMPKGDATKAEAKKDTKKDAKKDVKKKDVKKDAKKDTKKDEKKGATPDPGQAGCAREERRQGQEVSHVFPAVPKAPRMGRFVFAHSIPGVRPRSKTL